MYRYIVEAANDASKDGWCMHVACKNWPPLVASWLEMNVLEFSCFLAGSKHSYLSPSTKSTYCGKHSDMTAVILPRSCSCNSQFFFLDDCTAVAHRRRRKRLDIMIHHIMHMFIHPEPGFWKLETHCGCETETWSLETGWNIVRPHHYVLSVLGSGSWTL